MVALLLSMMGLLDCLPVGAAGLALGYVLRDRARRDDATASEDPALSWAIRLGWAAIAISLLALIALGVLALVRSDM